MGTLKEDIKTQSDWIVKAFAADGYQLNYSIKSIVEIDRFFISNMKNGKPKKGGRLYGKGYGPIIFSMGAYVGETIIKNVKGAEWVTNDNDPEAEINVYMKLPDDAQIWPIQKMMNRFKNGSEDAIYPYVHAVTNEFTQLPFEESFWKLTEEPASLMTVKPWWRFW